MNSLDEVRFFAETELLVEFNFLDRRNGFADHPCRFAKVELVFACGTRLTVAKILVQSTNFSDITYNCLSLKRQGAGKL